MRHHEQLQPAEDGDLQRGLPRRPAMGKTHKQTTCTSSGAREAGTAVGSKTTEKALVAERD